jgi:hypothetical protein
VKCVTPATTKNAANSTRTTRLTAFMVSVYGLLFDDFVPRTRTAS